MSGQFTKLDYDKCAYAQRLKESTAPMGWEMDLNRYVNVNNFAGYHSGSNYPYNATEQVDFESSLLGLDVNSSKCSGNQQPFCGDKGCITTFSPEVTGMQWSPPWAYEWNHSNDPSNPGVVTTNMTMPTSNGIRAQVGACNDVKVMDPLMIDNVDPPTGRGGAMVCGRPQNYRFKEMHPKGSTINYNNATVGGSGYLPDLDTVLAEQLSDSERARMRGAQQTQQGQQAQHAANGFMRTQPYNPGNGKMCGMTNQVKGPHGYN